MGGGGVTHIFPDRFVTEDRQIKGVKRCEMAGNEGQRGDVASETTQIVILFCKQQRDDGPERRNPQRNKTTAWQRMCAKRRGHKIFFGASRYRVILEVRSCKSLQVLDGR